MKQLKKMVLIRQNLLFLFIWTGILSSSAFGEKMPIKHLTIADGLPQNSINCINQDDKGFFWIGTNGGLARFDGYDFVNYTKQEGLPRNEISDFLKTRDGNFWLATKGGLVKFTPNGTIFNQVIKSTEVAGLGGVPMFMTYPLPDSPSNSVTKLLQDSKGIIWIGTEKNVYTLIENESGISILPVDLHNSSSVQNDFVYALYEDRNNAVWIGTENSLIRIGADNQTTSFQIPDESPIFSAILEDKTGNLWVGTIHKGLFLFSVDGNGTPQVVKQFASQPDSEIEWIDAIIEAADGQFWISGDNGLYEFEPLANKLYRYTRSSGLNYYRFQTMFKDGDDNLWLGTKSNGIYRLSTHGLTAYENEDRISFVRSVGLDNQGNLILTAFVTDTALDEKGARILRDVSGKVAPPFEWRFGTLDENGFSWIVPKFPRSISQYGSGINQLSFQSLSGEWWIATGQGLFRFPKVALKDLAAASPIEIFDEGSVLKSADIYRVYEDSRGDVWVATTGAETKGFYKWERATDRLLDMTAHGFSEYKGNLINAFAEDKSGNIWIGFNSRGLARLRNGKVEIWDVAHKIPTGGITALLLDRENRLWAATQQGGLLRIDNPQADTIDFVNYTVADGLSSNRTLSVTQDRQGLIYVGTDHDISRLNPQTNEFKTLNLAKDQAQRDYRSAVCDKDGVVWFGTSEGLIKYVPLPDNPPTLPEILITGVSVESVPQPVSATGAIEINLPTLSPQQNQVRINYVSLGNSEDENIRYQYKFDENEWSPPEKERFVNFANLSAGNYRVYIRAIKAGGFSSQMPAVVIFRILSPIYLRWWFFTLVLMLTALVIYAFYRTRLQKLLEIERARTLIATDLHDDIGSNLSKISVLSEVVKMQLEREGKSDGKLLASIADISRQSVSSMSDIVWAINPKRDSALETVRKMREYAEDIFVQRGVIVLFTEPDKVAKIKLPMHLRRDLYLIFKEAVSNVAKHSDCSQVEIIFQIKNSEILLKIKDDGHGFDPDLQTHGNGLLNMQNRVEKLKGKFECESKIGGGTSVEIRVPQN